MSYQHSIFDTPRGPEFLDLGPYEVDYGVERITMRRGKPARPARDHLNGDEIGILAVAGAAVGTAIAFLIDARGAAAALLSTVGL